MGAIAFLLNGGNELSKSGVSKGGGSRRADYINRESMSHVLAALMPENRLAIEVAIATGLRIGDVLRLRTNQLIDVRKGRARVRERLTVEEQKTGKKRRIYLPIELRNRLAGQAGSLWVFEGRNSSYKHRTRQAVAKDIQRARRILRGPKNLVVSAHTARKMYAVDIAREKGPEAAQKALLHSDAAITQLYAMADAITARAQHGKRKELYKEGE